MKFRAFIGIDVSKSNIDIYLRNAGRHAVFVNDLKGFEAMVEWLMDILGQVCPEEMMFGMEHTGLYSFIIVNCGWATPIPIIRRPVRAPIFPDYLFLSPEWAI